MRTYRLSNNRISWDENLIRSELSTIIDDLGLDYFPSRKEIRDYFGNQKLTNALDDSQFGVGEESKWDIYKNDWGIIIQFADFFKGYKEQPRELGFVQSRYN